MQHNPGGSHVTEI